jgi:hypothetical protein
VAVLGNQVAREPQRLVLLITAMDRHRDAERLTQAGLRVIATSHAQSSIRQMLDAGPGAIAVELVPSMAAETFAFVAQLVLASHVRRIPLLIYGTGASPSDVHEVASLGAIWVQLTPPGREELATAVGDALTAGENLMFWRSHRA